MNSKRFIVHWIRRHLTDLAERAVYITVSSHSVKQPVMCTSQNFASRAGSSRQKIPTRARLGSARQKKTSLTRLGSARQAKIVTPARLANFFPKHVGFSWAWLDKKFSIRPVRPTSRAEPSGAKLSSCTPLKTTHLSLAELTLAAAVSLRS